MARKSFFLLALAVVAIISIFANSADAKVRKHMIGGIPYLTTGTDGQVIDSVGWVKKGEGVSLTWATPAKKAVVAKKVRLPKASASAKEKKLSKKQPSKSKKATKIIISAAAKAPMTGTAFKPVQSPSFWTRLGQGARWIFTGEWNYTKPVVIPNLAAISPPPAPAQATQPAKPTKLKKRVKKRFKKRVSLQNDYELFDKSMQTPTFPKIPPAASKPPAPDMARVIPFPPAPPMPPEPRALPQLPKLPEPRAMPRALTTPAPPAADREFKSAYQVERGYYQYPQKSPCGQWVDTGTQLTRVDPHTGNIEYAEKPVQEILFFGRSKSGRMFVHPVFGSLGSCPEGMKEFIPTKVEKRGVS